MENNKFEKMYTMNELANILGRPISTAWRWARTGVIPAKRFGKVYLIKGSDVQHIIENGIKRKGYKECPVCEYYRKEEEKTWCHKQGFKEPQVVCEYFERKEELRT